MSALMELFFEKPGVVLKHLTCFTTAKVISFENCLAFPNIVFSFISLMGPSEGFA